MKKSPCFSAADILLPDFRKVSAERWAVVACDQFTSEPEYWERAEAIVGGAPSTLRLILPEVRLDHAEESVPEIHAAMEKYVREVLVSHPDSMIYVRRTQSDGTVRRGLLLAVDLECYDYRKGAGSLIRATEATVVERIPPRMAVRRGAELELPHVMLLIDDPEDGVIAPLEAVPMKEPAYDTDLMLGGGHIAGRFLTGDEQAKVTEALNRLITPEAMEARYGDRTLAPLLFAVGDGNHSLASAKATYEELKAAIGEEAASTHPARYALAEVVNIHDSALKFEPIYRVMFRVNPEELIGELKAYAAGLSGDAGEQRIEYIAGESTDTICIAHPVRQLTVGTLQEFLDGYLKAHPEAGIDYIHGEEAVRRLSLEPGSVGFLFSGMGKDELFRTVMFDGALPRKTFSMGHAEDKRYYLECRKISR